MPLRKRLLLYLSAVAAAGGMALVVLWVNDFSAVTDNAERLRLLADAFTVPGVLLMMFSALIWIGSDGFFDGLGYAGRWTVRLLLPFGWFEEEKYSDYKLRKAKNRVQGYSFLFFTGLAFLLIAAVWIVCYYARAGS